MMLIAAYVFFSIHSFPLAISRVAQFPVRVSKLVLPPAGGIKYARHYINNSSAVLRDRRTAMDISHVTQNGGGGTLWPEENVNNATAAATRSLTDYRQGCQV